MTGLRSGCPAATGTTPTNLSTTTCQSRYTMPRRGRIIRVCDHDLSVAEAHNNPPETLGPPLITPGTGSSQTPALNQCFPAQTIAGPIRITPLLTPDPGVYADAVKALIHDAHHTLYMQFQYIEPPKQTNAISQAFVDLIQAAADRRGRTRFGVTSRRIRWGSRSSGYATSAGCGLLPLITSLAQSSTRLRQRRQRWMPRLSTSVDGSSLLDGVSAPFRPPGLNIRPGVRLRTDPLHEAGWRFDVPQP